MERILSPPVAHVCLFGRRLTFLTRAAGLSYAQQHTYGQVRATGDLAVSRFAMLGICPTHLSNRYTYFVWLPCRSLAQARRLPADMRSRRVPLSEPGVHALSGFLLWQTESVRGTSDENGLDAMSLTFAAVLYFGH